MNKEQFAINVLKKGFFVELEPVNDINPEYEKLYRRVLDVALSDLLKNDPETVIWFDLKNPDFEVICDFATIDKVIVYLIISHILKLEVMEKKKQWKETIRHISQTALSL